MRLTLTVDAKCPGASPGCLAMAPYHHAPVGPSSFASKAVGRRGRLHSRFSEELDRQGGTAAPSSRPRRVPAAPGLPRHPRPSWPACWPGEAGHGGNSHPSRTGDRAAPPSRHTSPPVPRASIGTGGGTRYPGRPLRHRRTAPRTLDDNKTVAVAARKPPEDVSSPPP